MSLALKPSHRNPVPSFAILIEEEVRPINIHLSHDCLIFTVPDIRLLSSGRIEAPLIVIGAQFWPDVWVAMSAADDICLLMLALEVKDVYW